MNAAIRFNQVEKHFEERNLFNGLDLTIATGEFVCLLGPSGCGKSTLLRLIANLEPVSNGSIEVSGGHSHMGTVFQDPRLLGWKTVKENIGLPLEFQGKKLSESTFNALLSQVKLEPSTARLFPRQLSGGMKMRVALARALSNDPSLLLMDEPLAALDETTRFQLQEEIRRIYEQSQPQRTVVFVTHSVSEAAFLSTRVILLNHKGEKTKDLQNPLPAHRGERLREQARFFEQTKEISEAFRSLAVEVPR